MNGQQLEVMRIFNFGGFVIVLFCIYKIQAFMIQLFLSALGKKNLFF